MSLPAGCTYTSGWNHSGAVGAWTEAAQWTPPVVPSALSLVLVSAGTAVINGSAANVYWQVGSSATLGTATLFAGSLIAGVLWQAVGPQASFWAATALALGAFGLSFGLRVPDDAGGVGRLTTRLEALAGILAACIHDYEHRGLNNDYLVKSLVMMYVCMYII